MRRRALTALSIGNKGHGGTQSSPTLRHHRRAKRGTGVGTLEQGEPVRGRIIQQVAILLAWGTVGLGTAISPAMAQTWEPLFGPKTYFGTARLTDVYKEPFLALPGRGTLSIKNGSDDGSKRVRTARIS